ncbi:putative ALBINO3-like protein 1, chloroplastic [Cocos nucifera]|uniref:Putative ALBINO3-like protein 1, chloroplastic n=1 Tax=Cocos nucifera TaxID=13894 RepID=A0A8K0N0Q9_COCNU|nr:putative ALBINO3-like protein 1, chloroplastic [Cocos nucifera]
MAGRASPSTALGGRIPGVEGLRYTLADAAVAADPFSTGAAATTSVQKNGGWFGFISDAMKVVLKVLKDGLTAIHIPYAYGFAIILLTVIVKVATFPLTKKQVNNHYHFTHGKSTTGDSPFVQASWGESIGSSPFGIWELYEIAAVDQLL